MWFETGVWLGSGATVQCGGRVPRMLYATLRWWRNGLPWRPRVPGGGGRLGLSCSQLF